MDCIFATVQALGRSARLAAIPADDFDYIVIDEFHHAAAASYRRVIDHFRAEFLLGLTATPERTDGRDLLALCDDNLVFSLPLFQAIERAPDRLVPFHYFGVPDDVHYENIPWRSRWFDEQALTTAVATTSRADNALEEWRKRAGTRTLAFCVSTAHADFMADHFLRAGIEAVAVHSRPSYAPRFDSIERFQAGNVQVIFTVDLFNEGVDIPEADTLLMLRPTESRLLFIQQLGRGLRTSSATGKQALTVIDYIGNHEVFLIKPMALLGLQGQRDVERAMDAARDGRITKGLPPGCSVTYSLEARNLLALMARKEADPRRLTDEAGRVRDAAFHVEVFEGSLSVVLHARGGKLGTAKALNTEYTAGLGILLQRLAHLGTTLIRVELDTREERRNLDVGALPVEVATVPDLTALARLITRQQGNNPTRRIRLHIEVPSALSRLEVTRAIETGTTGGPHDRSSTGELEG